MDNFKTVFLGVLLIVVFSQVLFSERGFVVAGPPLSGDWVVTGAESYYDQTIVLNGNLIVEPNGNLTFRKVTLKMNCAYDGQYNITSDGELYVLDGSVITSTDPDEEYAIVVRGGVFRMSNSEFHECGFESLTGLQIFSEDAVIENSLLSHNRDGVDVHKNGAIIRNNNITANDGFGVSVCGGKSPTVYNNHISWNKLSGINADPHSSPTIYNNTITSNYGDGIFFWDEANPVIQDNTITSNNGAGISFQTRCSPSILDNLIMGNLHGIHFGDFCNPTIANNTIISNLDVGITFHGHSNPVIERNFILSHIWAGISCSNSSGIIQGNTITNVTDAIVCSYSNPIIQGNSIINNTGTGIWCTDHSNPTIRGNIITFYKGYGIGCRDQSQPEIHKNDIYRGVEGGYDLCNEDESVVVNATYNYWGSKSGPVPEKISQNVLYNPWLTESIFSLEIASPLTGEIVSSTVTVSTEVHAQSGVERVEFYIDDQLKHTDDNTPYEWNWDTKQYTETDHKITAKAHDTLGLKISSSVTVFVDNTPPTISIREPTPANTYSGVINISVNATDNKELGRVHFRVDNTEWLTMTQDPTDRLWKYDLNTTTLSDGNHTLMVLALDKAGNPATISATLRTDNRPPALTIQTPQSGVTVGLTLTVQVQASDVSGVSKIEFYLQDVLVCTITETPYQWLWDTTRYPNGEYTIIAKAYDTIGNVKTSQTTVTVKNVELPWWQTQIWTIIQVLIAIGGLTLATLTYLSRRKEKRKKKRRSVSKPRISE